MGYHLTPFALKTDGSIAADAQLTIANPDIATQFKDDKLLTAEQIANGEANFSDMWLADRAAMLSWVVKRNKEDNIKTVLDSTAPDVLFRDKNGGQNAQGTSLYTTEIRLGSGGDENRQHFIFGANDDADTLTGGDKADHLYGMVGDDTLNGGKGNDWLEGGTGNDTLNGDEGADKLYGGAGDDTLTGGKGNDYLYGGAGADTYIHNDGDGNDVIIDSDGEGSIQVKSGDPLKGGKQVNGTTNLWESTDKQTRYALYHNGDGTDTLNIYLQNGERLFVKDWQDGDLGIKLADNEASQPTVKTDESDFYKTEDADEVIDGGDLLFVTVVANDNEWRVTA